MPEIKHNFVDGKMNKDLDERLVPNGQYTDANNIQVSTSDDDAVGSVQNLLGNTALVGVDNQNITNLSTNSGVCVGAIADEKNNCAYWLISSGGNDWNQNPSSVKTFKDTIYRTKHTTADAHEVIPVFIDFWLEQHPTPSSGNWTGSVAAGYTAVTLTSAANLSTGMYIKFVNTTGEDEWRQITVSSNTVSFDSVRLATWSWLEFSWAVPSAYGDLDVASGQFKNRVLRFDSEKLITGINIVDDLLFWTDNNTEPKKINISNSIAGTEPTKLNKNTRLVVSERNIDLADDIFVKEEDVLVIKKGPKEAPIIIASEIARSSSQFFGQANFSGFGVGDTVTVTTVTSIILNSIFRSNDVVLFGSGIIPTTENNHVRAMIIAVGTSAMTVEILSMSNTPSGNTGYDIYLEQSSTIFTEKFVRFATRWKYKNGEYSTISPFSTIAFRPGDFLYDQLQGFNSGMVNTVKEITIKDFIPYDIPGEVVQIDILYKESDSPIIYTVDNITKRDTDVSGINSWNTVNDSLFFNGEYKINSENIYSIIPSNQILRPWDAVPRKALAQSVVGNRVVYGNYLQNYDLKNDSGNVIKPEMNIVVKDRKEVGAEMLKNNLATAFNATASNNLDGWTADSSWQPIPFETGDFLGGGFEPLVLAQGITKGHKIYQNLTFENDATYIVKFKVKNRTRGTLRVTLVTSTKFGRADVNADGEYEFQITLSQANGGVQDNLFIDNAAFSIQSINAVPKQGFNGQISNISCKKLTDNNKKSIKSQRNYQVGVVYADEFGRQTPVLTSKSASIKVRKYSADNENSLNVRLENEIPSFAHKFKYFVKENSSEYYNLAVDRIYSSSDGNAWVSFPSFERNKITEETYLILKKQLDAGLVQSESAVYKVLGIENEAPPYIKQTRDELGTADGVTSSSGTLNGVFTDVNYRPVDDQKVLAIRKPRWINDENCPPLDGLENLVLRFFDGGSIRTDWLEVSFIELKDVNGIDFYYLHLKNPITDQDSSWIMNGNNFSNGVTVTAATSILVDRPEFAGKFFVKLKLDDNLSQFVLAQAVITQASFAIAARSETFYSSDDAIVGIGVGTATRYQKDSASGGNSGSNDVRLKVPNTTPAAQGVGIIHGSITHGGGTKYPWIGTDEGGYFWDTSGDSSFSTGRGVVKDIPGGAPGSDLYLVMSEYAVHKWGRLLKFLKYSSYTFQTIPDNNETRKNFFIDNVGYCGTQPLGNEDPNNGTFQDPGHWNHFYNVGTFNADNASFTRRQDLTRLGSAGTVGNGQFDTNLPGRFGRGIFEATGNEVDQQGNPDNFFEQGKFYMELSYAKIWAADTQNNVALADIETPSAYSTAWSVGSPNNDNHSAEQLFVSRLRTGSFFRFSGDATETVYKITNIKKERRYNHTPWPFAKGHLGNPAHEYPIAIAANPGPSSLQYGTAGHYYPGTTDFAPTNAIFASNIRNDNEYFDGNIEMAVKDNGGELGFFASGISGNAPITTHLVDGINGEYTIDEELTRFGLATNRRVTWIMEIENATAGATNSDGPGFSGNYEPLNRTTSNSSTEMDENTRQFIEFLEPSLDEENQIISSNPAVFETQPKTDEGLDIYYEASDFISVGDHGMQHELPWFNCYSFGNGVESNRIKDDFNQVFVDKNAIVSTTLQGEYNEEHRKYGLIYSGLYNSISGVNDTSQFIAAEKITKDINPEYGSIQKLYTRNSDLLTLCEDKSLRILANKDAVFNADGNTNLTATENVLGQTIPFAGNYGISQNPESFTAYNYRVYFSDKQRGAILRLSMDGLTPISDYGMKSWFKDNLKDATKVLGSYDNDKKEYNVTISNASNYTVSFSEKAKGWPSFKSFIPNQGLSVANNYYTFAIQDSTTNSKVWLHHKNTTYNNFYGAQYNSDVTLVLNDGADIIKNFKTLSYEGTQSKTLQNLSDTDNYYNIGADIAGWEAQTIATDKQTGSINEFIEKEGKWFNFIKGDTTTLSNLDTSEFTVQGLGKITAEDI